MDNISHRGGSALDELVPSRYALQVGDIDVLVISDGVLPITASTLATNAPPPELAGWLADMFLPPDVLDWASTWWWYAAAAAPSSSTPDWGWSFRVSRGPARWRRVCTPPASIRRQ